MNFFSEDIFEFGALQVQPAARGSEGASIGFGSHFQLLVAGEKSTDLLRANFQPPPLLPFAWISFRKGETTLSSLWVLHVASLFTGPGTVAGGPG